MKKYLIISLSTGGGHATVGNSLADKLRMQGDEVLVIDLFKEINSKTLHNFVCEGYNLIATKVPQIYEIIYRAGNKPIIAKGSFEITRWLSQKRILELIDDVDPDVIIAVHPIVTELLGTMKKKGYLKKQKLASVVTDFLAHFVYVHRHKYVDAYFVGSETTKADLIEWGVEEDKVFPFGIPIKKEFYAPRVKAKNHIFTILIMGGSLGSRNMTNVIKRLFEIEKKIKIIVVCGKDAELKEKMDKLVGKYESKEVEVYGFVDNIYSLMDSADLLISKPGGASVTEALLRRIPMIIPYMIGGQEKENRDYLIDSGAAIWVSKVKEIPFIINKLIEEPEILDYMESNMDEIASGFSIDSAIEKLTNM